MVTVLASAFLERSSSEAHFENDAVPLVKIFTNSLRCHHDHSLCACPIGGALHCSSLRGIRNKNNHACLITRAVLPPRGLSNRPLRAMSIGRHAPWCSSSNCTLDSNKVHTERQIRYLPSPDELLASAPIRPLLSSFCFISAFLTNRSVPVITNSGSCL